MNILTSNHHELLACLKEQGYYEEIAGRICFGLDEVCLVEDLVKDINSQNVQEASHGN